MQNTTDKASAKYIVIVNRKGGKDTWHRADCKRGQRAAEQREAEGWENLVHYAATARGYHHRLATQAKCCNPNAFHEALGWATTANPRRIEQKEH